MKKKSLKKSISGIMAAGVLALPMATGASAASAVEDSFGNYEIVENDVHAITSGKKDGGYWIRGITTFRTLKSEYKHYKTKGYAAVVNGAGKVDEGGWKSKDVYSKASIGASITGTNKTYYDNEL